MKRRLIIFSGFNQRAVVAMLRTVSKLNVPKAIIAASHTDTIFATIYAKDVCAVRTSLELKIDLFIPVFEKLAKLFKGEELIVAPSTETLIRLFLKNKTVLKKYSIILPVVSEELYLRISDKLNFNMLCQENGIAVPLQYNKLEICPDKFVAKPKMYYSNYSRKFQIPVLIKTIEEKEMFKKKNRAEDFYYEELVEGESYYLLYYITKNHKIIKFSQKNILQQSEGKSIILAELATIHTEEISKLFERLLLMQEFRGLIMIEVRKRNGIYYMIEANPRMWGPSQLFVDAGFNFFEVFLYDWQLINDFPKLEVVDDRVKYCWSGGLKNDLISKKKMSILDSKCVSIAEWITFLENDIYCRNDTMGIFEKE